LLKVSDLKGLILNQYLPVKIQFIVKATYLGGFFLADNRQFELMENKETIRQRLRKQRAQLPLIDQQQKSQNIIKHILHSEVFLTANNIAYYHAVNGEADPSELSVIYPKKQFFLPIVRSANDNQSQGLIFAPVSATSQYNNNIFNIPEPICDPKDLLNANKLDLLIMPLLGFDRIGNRLGMGGGFYDRTLAYKQYSPEKKPVLMGFAYDFQEVEKLNAEQWDIGLDWIATESEIINTSAPTSLY